MKLSGFEILDAVCDFTSQGSRKLHDGKLGTTAKVGGEGHRGSGIGVRGTNSDLETISPSG